MRLILFVIFLNTAFAKPQPDSGDAVIVAYGRESDASGGYNFFYQTSDGQSREEQGIIINPGTDKETLSVTGSYSFIGTDGKLHKTIYTADENGYQTKKYSNEGGSTLAFVVPDSKFNSFLSRINRERQKFTKE